MGSFRPAAGGGAAKILRKAPTVQNGADSRFVHLKRGRKRSDVRCQIDNRPGVQAAIRPAIQMPANARRERVVHRRVAEGAPASLKIFFAGQSLDRLAHSAARKRNVASIASLTSPICWPPTVPKQPHSMFNPRARAYQFPVEFGTLGRAALLRLTKNPILW